MAATDKINKIINHVQNGADTCSPQQSIYILGLLPALPPLA